MTRAELIRHPFQPSMRLIEIGASYNPIIPKAEGWRTTILDHTTEDKLREIYKNETPDRIEPVDFVWQGEALDTLLPATLMGQFDGLIASHVGEHIPNLIGFLQALDRLLKPTGIIALALPDKRVCFDFYQPTTTTGDLLDAHQQRRSRHRTSKIFDVEAYRVTRAGVVGWAYGMPISGGEMVLASDLATAYSCYEAALAQTDYFDTHGWQFTASSFQLNILELYHLGVIPWAISRIELAGGVEFYVWLERRTIKLNPAELHAQRNALLQQMITETAQEQLKQMSYDVGVIAPAAAAQPTVVEPISRPLTMKTVSAIVPLYNGARFIARSLDSILAQSLPPFEIIVVDDGSIDNGVEIVQEYQRRHPSIVLLQKTNGGQSSARNYGAHHARGDLLAFLDQDDVWYEMHLEKLIRPFLRPPAGQPLGWVYSNLDEADVDGHIIHHCWLTRMHNAPEHPKRVLYNCMNQDMFVLPSASLISRSVFETVGGFDLRLSGYEDDDLFLRIFHAGFQNIFLDMPLSKWCIHHQSSSFTPSMRLSRVIYSHKLLEQFPDQPKRHVYFTRDVILPRFYRHALAEFRDALEKADMALIAETLGEMHYLLIAARQNEGINKMISQRQAVRLEFLFRHLTPSRALFAYQMRRKLGRSHHRFIRRFLPVYG